MDADVRRESFDPGLSPLIAGMSSAFIAQIPALCGTQSVRPRTDPQASTAQNDSMTDVTEYFNWWVVDELTGAAQLTRYKLSRANAQRAFPGAEPDVQTREVHALTEPGELSRGRRATDGGNLAGAHPQMT